MRVIASQASDGRSVGIVGAESPPRIPARRDAHGMSRRGAVGSKRRNSFSDADLVAFFSNTATLLSSGVPLIKSLEALATDDTFKKAASTFEDLIRDIRSGSSFSAAASKHPACFSPMAISLIRAGESSGTLVTVLERIADNLERRQDTKSQIRKALTYPTIVTVLGGAAVGFLMAFVVPVFEETYSKAGMQLPTITRVLIAASGVVAKTWWIVLLLLVAAVLLYRHFRQHPQVRSFRDRMLLQLPLLGSVMRGVVLARFVEAFGSLLAAGVTIKEVLFRISYWPVARVMPV